MFAEMAEQFESLDLKLNSIASRIERMKRSGEMVENADGTFSLRIPQRLTIETKS